MTVRTQGTEVYFLNAGAIVKLAAPSGVSGLGGANDQIDTTNLGDTERTFVQGLANPGTVTIPFNFQPSQTSQQLLFTLRAAGTTLSWLIGLSDSTAQPTVTSGAFVPPTGRTCVRFSAYIADVNIDIATNEVVRGTLTLQRSGSVTWNYAV